MLKSYKYTIAFISWMMFVTFSSLYSFSDVDTHSIRIPHLDKAVHFTFYCIASILGVFFLRERSKGTMSLNKAMLLMLLGTIAFGILMEVLQYNFTSERTGDIFDGIANTLGSFCGILLMKHCFSKERWLKWQF